MKKQTHISTTSSSALRYALPIIVIVLIFIFLGIILFSQRKQELSSLELRLQMQASLLGEKISSKLHTYEMTIALLEQGALTLEINDKEGKALIENSIRNQLLLQEGLERIYLYSIDGRQLYSSYYIDHTANDEINALIMKNHIQQEKGFAITSITHKNKKEIVMSKILYNVDSLPHAILALVIETENFFDPLVISMLDGLNKAALYNERGEVFALWYHDTKEAKNLDSSITNISQLSQFSTIQQLELQESAMKGGVRILSTKDVYIPLSQISNFPLTVALHVDIPTIMAAYDGATYINLIAIFILLAILIFINHRLNHQRNAKEALQHHMVTELTSQVQKRTAELEKLSTQDALTGLINRRLFNIHLEQEVKNNTIYATPFSLIAIDVDEFKYINDTYGHVIGDEVLIHISQQLKKRIDAKGYISRWGGDELMILLPNMEQENAYNTGVELCSLVEREKFRDEITCTISIGVAQYRSSEELITLIRRADTALYQAKAEGRNRAILYEEPS